MSRLQRNNQARPILPDRIVLRHLRLPLVHHFETSFGRVNRQETVIVEVHAAGLVGYGESPASAAPFYSAETVHTCLHVMRDFLVPMLRDAARKAVERMPCRDDVTGRSRRLIVDPTELPGIFARVRGHNMAKAGLEAALWDLKARLEHKPLHALYGARRKRIPAGVSLGIEDSIEALLERIRLFVARGYRRIKLKIKPGWDVDVLDRVRAAFPLLPLMVDANSAYSLKDLRHLKRLDRYRLLMIEQPLGWDDIIDHARLQKALRTPICLDESIHSPDDARKAIELGACRIINIKPARVGGPTRALQVHDTCRKLGVPVWCGGLLETGIGRAHNIAIAALPGFLFPGDISGSDRYYKRDVISPPVQVDSRGWISVPRGSGLGFQVDLRRLAEYTTEALKL
ncbi:MAG: o-succinylbenzoate synthase [Planctomycetota bacterium]|nr:o-succinylbenzoate synthase [Planctomycetota bacterium]